jgi:hypothetical protein
VTERRSLPVIVLDRLARALRGRDRSVLLGVTAGALATLLGTAVLVAAFLWPADAASPAADTSPSTGAAAPGAAQLAGPVPGPASPSAASSGASPGTSPSSKPAPGTTGASRTVAPVPLTARFAKGSDAGLASYAATATIANPGPAAVTGWTMRLTLPRNTLTVSDVSGATVTRDGAVWTFVPDAGTARVNAGGAVTVSFRVGGAALLDATPTACTIDGNPCQGVG